MRAMKTVQFHRFGEPQDVLEVRDEPAPTPAAGELRVTLTARRHPPV